MREKWKRGREEKGRSVMREGRVRGGGRGRRGEGEKIRMRE